jgi:hypothetical protein
MDIVDTIKARAASNGDYETQAEIAQELKRTLRTGLSWDRVHAYEAEALDMIAHKLARIVNGDPHFHDHWHDIQGYAKLAADRNAVQS